jgi:hypothetical protein
MRKPMALMAVLVLAAGCSRTPRVQVDPHTGKADVDMEPRGQHSETWRSTLHGTSGFSSMTGSATAVVDSHTDMTMVRISVRGAPAGGSLPWHIHEGRCSSGDAGDVVGSPSAYSPIETGTDGSGTSEAHLSLKLNEAKDYKIVVHASVTDLANVVSCAALDD